MSDDPLRRYFPNLGPLPEAGPIVEDIERRRRDLEIGERVSALLALEGVNEVRIQRHHDRWLVIVKWDDSAASGLSCDLLGAFENVRTMLGKRT